MRRAMAALGTVIALVSCAGANDTLPTSEPSLSRGTLLIDTEDDSVLLSVLVAETPEEREVALAEIASLEEDEGIVLLYFESPVSALPDTSPSIPLSVAFFDVEGAIVDIVEVMPCTAEMRSCRRADVQSGFMGALGVNRGNFDRLGVHVGDDVVLVPGSE